MDPAIKKDLKMAKKSPTIQQDRSPRSKAHDKICKSPHLTKQDSGGIKRPGDVWKLYVDGRAELPEQQPFQYADLTVASVEDARNMLADLYSAFDQLPALVRDGLGNDPANLLDYSQENAERIAESDFRQVLWDDFYAAPPQAEPVSNETVAQNAQETPATDSQTGAE